LSPNEFKRKIKELQELFDIPQDGILREALAAHLNVPLQVRIEELKRALNSIRWSVVSGSKTRTR